jgi:hypothetical protein
MRDFKAALEKKCSKGIGVDVVAAGAIPAMKYTATPAARIARPVTAPKKKVFTKTKPSVEK